MRALITVRGEVDLPWLLPDETCDATMVFTVESPAREVTVHTTGGTVTLRDGDTLNFDQKFEID